MDVEKGRDTSVRFAVLSVPTILIFKGGKVIEEITGLVPKKTILNKIGGII
jgi:thioredoxin 1